WTRGIAAAHVAFRTFILRRRPGCKFSQLNSPPRLFPCLRFAVHLAMPNAKLGAKVDRYSFFVRLLPPLLHTGLARRTNIAISLTDPEKGEQTTQACDIACFTTVKRGKRTISLAYQAMFTSRWFRAGDRQPRTRLLVLDRTCPVEDCRGWWHRLGRSPNLGCHCGLVSRCRRRKSACLLLASWSGPLWRFNLAHPQG